MCSYMRTFPLKVHYQNLGCEMGWYEVINAHFLLPARRGLGGLLGTTTKSVRSILHISKYLLDGWDGLKAYFLEKKKKKKQSKDAHFSKNFCRATRGEIILQLFCTAFTPRFARCSMASTLQICFLRLCNHGGTAIFGLPKYRSCVLLSTKDSTHDTMQVSIFRKRMTNHFR